MKKGQKLVTLALATIMASSFAACGGGSERDEAWLNQFEKVTDATRPSWEYDTADYDVSWFIDASWMQWPTNGADLVSRTIYEKTGCKIEFRTATDEESTELSTLVSSGDLPDVVTVKASSLYASQLPSQDFVWSMDTLMEKFAPSMIDRYRVQQKDVYDWFKQDGEFYGIPNLSYSDYYVGDTKLSPNGAILVREDWYKEAAQAGYDMTTKESFLAGCDYITKKYPNAIGVQLDPFTPTGNLSATWLSQYFAVPFEKTDGTYNYQILDEKYKEVITFLNTLASKGYINSANFTANTAAVGNNISSGKVFVSMATPQNYNNNFVAARASAKVEYIPLVLKNDAGDAPILQDLRGKGYMLSFITKDCERPDKVIKLFDYMTSEEGQLLINFGVEGLTFNWDEKHEKVVWTEQYITNYENNSLAQYGFGYCNALLNQSFYDKVAPISTQCRTEASTYIEDLKAPLQPYSYDYTASFLLPDTSATDYFDFIEMQNQVNQIWGMYFPQMIMASNNTDALALYDNAVQAMKNNGLDFVVSFMAQSYQRAKTAVGVEHAWPAYQAGYQAPVTGANGDFSCYKYKN